jgi:hypothetical protein
MPVFHNEETILVLPGSFPQIVCLCGSTKFKENFLRTNMELTLAGKIVVTVGAFMHADHLLLEDEKRGLDLLHLRKIDLANEVMILNCGGYIGASTARELAYAVFRKKRIVFLEATGEKFMETNSHLLGRLVAEFMNCVDLPSVGPAEVFQV